MIIVDVETTGLDPSRNSLVSIGAISFDNSEERFYEECRIWDGAEINPEALLINGLTNEGLIDMTKKSEKEVVLNFKEWVEGKKDFMIAGQNVHIDLSFLEHALKRAGEAGVFSYRIIDQHSLAYYHMLKRGLNPPVKDGKSSLNSDTIMRYVGIPEEPKPHIAINGAIWEYEVMHRLIHDKAGLEEFQAHPIPWLN